MADDALPVPEPKEIDEKNALEPHVSAKTLEFHYGKHHQGYVNKLNAAIEGGEFAAIEEDPLATIARVFGLQVPSRLTRRQPVGHVRLVNNPRRTVHCRSLSKFPLTSAHAIPARDRNRTTTRACRRRRRHIVRGHVHSFPIC